jgi:tRNA/tmRNA/rRNA uracil-C5-methylase (TrmA/RlmC/RlmD family)
MSRRPPLPREPIEATIDGFTHGGEGVARVEGKAVFVPGALPRERVRLQVTDDRKRWARADLLEVLEVSELRVPGDSHQLHPCGGCDLQHVTPAGQLQLKTQVVREQLERLGKLRDPAVHPCQQVGPVEGYRTNARFHAAADGRLGFHRPGTHEVVPLERCPALHPLVREVLAQVGDATGAAEVTIRAHERTGATAVVLTPGPGPLQLPDGDFDLLLEQPDGSLVAMRGDGVLSERVAGTTFRFDAGSFFQVNTEGAEAIVAEVLAGAALTGDVGGALVWDLYAGVGLLTLPFAATGAEVLGVEGHAPAADWLTSNAAAAGVGDRVRVLTDPVHRVTRDARRGSGDDGVALDPPDLVVLDPPRTGAGTDVVEDLAALEVPTIVYVACDPASLARDAAALTAAGYRLERAVPLDLFPLTHHVETVATFAR